MRDKPTFIPNVMLATTLSFPFLYKAPTPLHCFPHQSKLSKTKRNVSVV